MSCSPSGATLSTSTTPDGCDQWCPVRRDPAGQESTMESLQKELPGPTMDGPVSTGLEIGDESHLSELSLELTGAEQLGEIHTDAASATSVP